MKDIQAEDQLLIFKIGSVMCCVSARDVDSVINAEVLTEVPNQSDFIAGVFQYRDETVSVLNLYKKFDFPIPSDPEHGLYIMAYTEHGIVGYWVDEVIDITTDYGAHWSDPPIFVNGNVFDKTLIWNDELILSTDFNKLFAMNDPEPLKKWVNDNSEILQDSEFATEITAEDKEEVSLAPLTQIDDQELGSGSLKELEEIDIGVEPLTDINDTEISIDPLTDIENSEIGLGPLTEVDDSEFIMDSEPSLVEPINDELLDSQLDDLDSLLSSGISSDIVIEGLAKIPEESSLDSYSEITIEASLSELEKADGLSELSDIDESQITEEQQSTIIHVGDTVSIVVDNSDTIPEKIKPSRTSNKQNRRKTTENSQSKLKSHVEAALKQIPKRELKKVGSFEVATNQNTQTVYDAIKLYLEPTSKQVKWTNDPYSANKPVHMESAAAHDIERIFEEKIADKVKEYFESVEANDSGKENTTNPPKEKIESNPENDLLEEENDFLEDSNVIYAEEAFSSSESVLDEDEQRAKKEASVLKVIDRIEKQNPRSSSTTGMRGIASILFVACVIFVLSHYNLLPGSGDIEVDSLELLNETENDVQAVSKVSQALEAETALSPVVDEISSPEIVKAESDSVTDVIEPVKTEIQTPEAEAKPIAPQSTQVLAPETEVTQKEEPTIVSPVQEVTTQTQVESSALGALAFEKSNPPPSPVVIWNKHIVVRGDTLWDIADSYLNDPFRYPDLARWSKIKNPDLIYPGDEVKYNNTK